MTENEKIEQLIKNLESDFGECINCSIKEKKTKMVQLYNSKEDFSEYMCTSCFKRRFKNRKGKLL